MKRSLRVGKGMGPLTRAPVRFAVSTYGINTGGTVYRMDDVPITLRPVLESTYPGDQEVLEAIRDRVKELLSGKKARLAA